ncbi:phage shock protein PspA [Erythrobacter sp. KY5]|uniref:phage shock protein PspA n=1 Tax=Erythrobacter sp. KY5 TaxID=2011159 RepID=UPI0035120A48
MSIIVSKRDDIPGGDPFGPERKSPVANADFSDALSPMRARSNGSASAHPSKLSRLDAEIEALRRSPTPTQTHGRSDRDDDSRQSTNPFLDGVAFMGIFSRTRDIIAANFNDMLDKADDPQKMIRMIILEMEETLVEVRASAARTIADQKEMHRHVVKLDKLQADWGEKAQLALSKDREDLARAALVEKKKATGMADQLRAEIAVLDDALRAYEDDIQKLQHRLREARSRQTAIAARLESAENRVKLRTLMSTERTDEALARFDQLERRVDYAEGRADAIQIGQDQPPSLSDEIAALEGADAIDDELAQMKKALGKPEADD